MMFAVIPRLASALPGRISNQWCTLGEWLDVYETLLEQRDYDPQIVKNYRANLKYLWRIWGHMPIHSIKPHHVSTALKEFLPERSPTARRVLSALQDVLVEAIVNAQAEMSPGAHVRLPPHKIKRKRLSFKALVKEAYRSGGQTTEMGEAHYSWR